MAHKGEKSNGSHYNGYGDLSQGQGGEEYERQSITPSSFKTPNFQNPSSNLVKEQTNISGSPRIEAINIISSPPEQGVFGGVSKRIPRTPLGGREEPTHMREERQRMKGGPPQVRPSEQAGKGKRPLVFVGDKQWNEYLNFNKRKRYDD